MSDDERALLWDAIEVSTLVEMRNGAEEIPAATVEDHRKRVGDALLGLIAKGLARAYLAPWGPPQQETRSLSSAELAEWLGSGRAWSQDEPLWVTFESTAQGETLVLGKPLG